MSFSNVFKTGLAILSILSSVHLKAQDFRGNSNQLNYFRDTTIFFFKHTELSDVGVATIDSAEYYKILCPPKREEELLDVYEYYKNGTVKFVGKADKRFVNMINGNTKLIGASISYFPSGKRQSICNYSLFGKDGMEYQYYPDGKPFQIIRYNINSITHISEENLLSCYDAQGVQICVDGKGRWQEYDRDFKKIVLEGEIKNGKREAKWIGKYYGPKDNSISYALFYHNGLEDSGEGYDSDGKIYPFKEKITYTISRAGPISFIDIFRKNLNLPKEYKQSIDTLNLTFVVERDGHLTNPGLKERSLTNEEKKAFEEALNASHKWEPSRFFGLPVKTTVFMPLKAQKGYKNYSYNQSIIFGRKLIFE